MADKGKRIREKKRISRYLTRRTRIMNDENFYNCLIVHLELFKYFTLFFEILEFFILTFYIMLIQYP